MRWIIKVTDDIDRAEIGPKAFALAELTRAGFPVPEWFVVRPEAFWQSLPAAARTAVASSPSSAYAVRSIGNIVPTESLRTEIAEASAAICPHQETVAVRMSSDKPSLMADADDSFLYVSADKIVEKIAAIWKSFYGAYVASYRQGSGAIDAVSPPAILIMSMVTPQASGVAYSSDPVSGRRAVAVVGAVYGRHANLMADMDADVYRVDRGGQIIERRAKATDHSYDEQFSTLSNDEVSAIADLARRSAAHFVRPQQIAWALQDKRLYLLQTTAVTALDSLKDPDAPARHWDNHDIVDICHGVTTPLTFSFARRATLAAARSVPKMRGVLHGSDESILGYIDGCIYYDADKWDRLLDAVSVTRQRGGYAISPRAMLMCMFLPCNHRRFGRRVESLFVSSDSSLEQMRIDELLAQFRAIENDILSAWEAPIEIEALAQFFVAHLAYLCQAWIGPDHGGLLLDLLSGVGDVPDAEAVSRLVAMADLSSSHPNLMAVLLSGSANAEGRLIREHPDFQVRLQDYMTTFGDLCPNGLKLESETVDANSTPLLNAIGVLGQSQHERAKISGRGKTDGMRMAQNIVRRSLVGKRLKKIYFDWALARARSSIRLVSEVRHDRMRIVGRVRRLFAEIGKRLFAEGAIAAPGDVYFLMIEEIIDRQRSTAVTSNLKALVAVRQDEYRAHTGSASPKPSQTSGSPSAPARDPASEDQKLDGAESADERRGVGCSPGSARGAVRILADADDASVIYGEIIVIARADPGRVIDFAAAGGLIVEQEAGLTSSVSIVAREIGLPMVSGMRSAATWLRDGDIIELDGAAGVVWLPGKVPARVPHVEAPTDFETAD